MTELFRYGRIETTHAKALAMRAQAEHLVSVAKRGNTKRKANGPDVHERRLVASVLYDAAVVTKLFGEIAPKFADRSGGYTRLLQIGKRVGDGADMVILELVS